MSSLIFAPRRSFAHAGYDTINIYLFINILVVLVTLCDNILPSMSGNSPVRRSSGNELGKQKMRNNLGKSVRDCIVSVSTRGLVIGEKRRE